MKTVLITGANKGLGYETAKKLITQGYFVYLGSRDATNGEDAIESLKNEGFSAAEFLEIDVTSLESIKRAKELLGGKIENLDVLINNAGISGDYPQNASEIGMDTLRKVFEVNFFGSIQVTQEFLPLLKKSSEPRIVNVSSDLGSLSNQTNPDYEFSAVKMLAYCSSKTALNAFTIMLADELKDSSFKINSVTPGYTATALNHFQGYRKAEESCDVIVKYATLDTDGPTGGFFSEEGNVGW